ncbi:hypothetical protein ACQKWADRAFT_326264 [Trichoderma austrokoningii]
MPENVLVSAGFISPTTIKASDATRLTIPFVTKESIAQNIPFTTLSLDSTASLGVDLNVRNIAQIIVSSKPIDQSTDSEYAIRNGQILVECPEPDTDLKTLLDAAQSGQSLPTVITVIIPLKDRGDETLCLLFRKPGLLHSYEYHFVFGLTTVDPITEGQMEIEVRSVGLNSCDSVMTMGQDKDTSFGMECAGIKSRMGSGVSHQDPRTFLHVPASISDKIARSLVGKYQAAVQSLVNVGRLQKDESVLIHSTPSDVGQATIIVAQHLGSNNIYCTFSSEQKKKFLMAEYGIPETHIFNSRGHSRFIELGKRDINDNTGLEMRPFFNNIRFSGVDIAALIY